MDRIAKRLVIHGQVQGVFYRAWTVQTAKSLGLCGWVRNVSDGTVEVLVCGQEDIINRLITACYEGPSHANVSNIVISDGEYDGLDIFEQIPSM